MAAEHPEDGTERNADDRPTAAREPWLRYIVTLAVTFVALFGGYGMTLLTLDRAGALPPPAIVNEICADEKLTWLRNNPPDAPNLLVVGSSLAWRGIDSQQFADHAATVRPLNGGVCHAGIDRSSWVAEYLLGHFPSVRNTLIVVAPQDFTACAETPDALFDRETVDAYVFGKRMAYPFYISQFDPISLARNAWRIASLRTARFESESLVMTPYGDGPLNAPPDRGLLYGPIDHLDPTCFTALRGFAAFLERTGRGIFVTTAPVHPDWRARYDPSGDLHRRFVAGIRAALEGVGNSEFWDGAEAFGGAPSDFTDAIHINWEAARQFTSGLVAVYYARHASAGAAPPVQR